MGKSILRASLWQRGETRDKKCWRRWSTLLDIPTKSAYGGLLEKLVGVSARPPVNKSDNKHPKKGIMVKQ